MKTNKQLEKHQRKEVIENILNNWDEITENIILLLPTARKCRQTYLKYLRDKRQRHSKLGDFGIPRQDLRFRVSRSQLAYSTHYYLCIPTNDAFAIDVVKDYVYMSREQCEDVYTYSPLAHKIDSLFRWSPDGYMHYYFETNVRNCLKNYYDWLKEIAKQAMPGG